MTDHDIIASRAVAPLFYRAPHPDTMKPAEYQHAGVEYALARDHHIFGDAPGLGKTAECILVGNAIGAKHTLVVCPASLRLNWEREIWRWSTLENVTTYPVLKSSDGVSLDANYVIISYALLANPDIHAALMDCRWDHVILDEAHAMKDPRGNTRTKAICGWMDHGTYRSGLMDVAGRMTLASGTLLPNQPIECYNAIRMLNWDAIDRASLEDFRENYYDFGGGMIRGPMYDKKKGAWVNQLHWSDKVRNVPRNLDDLQFRLRKHLMIRRLKEQVMHELPAKQWHPFPLAVTAEMRRAMKHPGWLQAERLYEMDDSAFDGSMPIDGAISSARLALGEAKMPSVAEYIEDLIEGGVTKVVVSAWHISVLHFLRDKLKHHGLVYMDGSTSATQKQVAVDRFQREDEIKIILGQTMPLGEGWTLTKAQDVVFAEPDWVPAKNEQMLDRIHRRGQTGSYVIGHVPVVPGTLDERILSTAIRKDKVIYSALDRTD